mgnify:CR=1 FL=1
MTEHLQMVPRLTEVPLECGRAPWIPNRFRDEVMAATVRIRRADATLERWVTELRRKYTPEVVNHGPRSTVQLPD